MRNSCFLGIAVGVITLIMFGCVEVSVAGGAVKDKDERETMRNVNDIYLLIGQSNMAGRGKYKKGDTFESGRVYTLNASDKFEKFGDYPWVNDYSTIRKSAAQISPGYMFAKKMVAAYPEKNICLLSNARGGTSLTKWVKGEFYFKEAVRRAKEAMKQGTLRGIIWHQGETDYRAAMRHHGEEKEHLDKYFKDLRQFIDDLRKELNAEDVPFIAGQVNQGYKLFNETILDLQNSEDHIYVVTTEGLDTIDGRHFDRRSVLVLGERYAEKMLNALGKK